MFGKYSNELNKTDQHLANAVLSTYINLKDNLSRKEISFIETHLSKCNDCKKRLNEMIEEDAEIDDYEDTKSQDYNIERLKKENSEYFIWAAAAILIITIGITVFYFLQDGNERVIVRDDKPLIDSLLIKEKPGNDDLTDDKKENQNEIKYNLSDFAANMVLENFINRNVRSESAVKIISPIVGDTLNIPITFKWEAHNETDIEIVNNKNQPVVKKILSGGSFTYAEELTPGLYYWKILTDSKLEAMGKFYIK